MQLLKQVVLLLSGILLLSAGSILAITADPNATVELTQPDGVTKLTVRPIGDERTGRLVTMDGYTIIKDIDGWWRYATLDGNERLVPSAVVATAVDQRSTVDEEFLFTLQPGLQDRSDRLVPLFEPLPDVKIRTMTSQADEVVDVVMLLIEFPDDLADYPSSDFNDLMNEPGFDYYGSMNDFFEENSYGQFGINGTVSSWYTANNNHSYYGYNSGNNWTAAATLVREAVLAADAEIDFSQFDIDGDGYVDALFVVHSGPGAESGYNDYPWSHAWSLTSAGLSSVLVDGVRVNRYSMEPEKRNFSSRITIGVFCHEYGHVLGIPDLYDTDYSSIGVGDWCLMAGGSWNGPYGGLVPSHFSAWCKYRLGWVDPVVVADSLIGENILDVETNPVMYRLWNLGEGGREYFMVEYRRKIGFDAYLPGCGLAVWHVDENMSGNSNDGHRLVDLEERDRSENNSSGDMYLNATFDQHSNPNSNSYSGDSSYVSLTVHSTACDASGLTVDLSVGDNLCLLDDDGDGWGNCDDNCPVAYNPEQHDWNGDGTGDACADFDGDGANDATDNCVWAFNAGQEDQDENGIGDACCCGVYNGGYTGNTNCSVDGLVTLSDITLMIDHVYISKSLLCCPDGGNSNGSLDGKCTLSDISVVIDNVFISKSATEPCP